MLIGINISIIILTDNEVTCTCEIISETHKEDDKKLYLKYITKLITLNFSTWEINSFTFLPRLEVVKVVYFTSTTAISSFSRK